MCFASLSLSPLLLPYFGRLVLCHSMQFFVLEGSFEEGGEEFQKDSWLRLPKDYTTTFKVGLHGAKVAHPTQLACSLYIASVNLNVYD